MSNYAKTPSIKYLESLKVKKIIKKKKEEQQYYFYTSLEHKQYIDNLIANYVKNNFKRKNKNGKSI